ncbi:MAG: CsgG/HfaB family protein, partial [Treponema sp.]|nr:CsgG/HfaB family protein [Treponema sp.]
MKRTFMAMVIAVSALNAGFLFGDTELHIQRVESKVNAGFKERVYIDGKSKLTLANGKSGVVRVADGVHTIHAELYSMETDKVSFNAAGGIMTISIIANSVTDFVIMVGGGAPVPAQQPAVPTQPAAPAQSPAVQRPIGQSTLEAALYAAADVIIARLQPKTTVAVVSIASRDIESAEFVLDELAYVIVSSGTFKVVDRKSLDAIRLEQNFQSSGDVDDDSAVSIGKLLGANIVITGSITGVGSTRRLRLKAL